MRTVKMTVNRKKVRTEKKAVKRAMAFMMAGVMCFSLAGCGKSDKKKKEEKLDIYDAVQEVVFDECIYTAKIVNDVFYGIYTKYNENSEEDYEEGLIKYDFNTKEQNSVAFNMPNTSVTNFYVDDNQNIVLNAQKIIQSDEPEENTSDFEYTYQDVKLVCNENLEVVSSKEGEIKTINDTTSDSMENVYGVEVDNQGREISLCGGMGAEEESYIKVNDKDGNETARIQIEDMAQNLVVMSDGTVACAIWGKNGSEVYRVDIEGGKLGEKLMSLSDSYNNLYTGLNNSLLIDVNGYLCRYNSESEKSQKILKFIDSNVNPNSISTIFELKNGTLGVILPDYETNKTEIDFLIKQDTDKSANKTEIRLGTLELDTQLQEQIIKFNKTNEKYKIVVDDYASDGDYEEGIKRFNAAVTSGNCPDIIDLSIMGMQEYAQKGILEDLIPYLEKDSELSEDLFVDSVINTYKINDKLYTIPMSFMIEALAGATSSVGSEKSWTMQEFVAYAESLPEGTEILDGLTSDGLLSNILQCNMGEYVNWSTGECKFNTDEFIKLLEFCSNYENSEKFYQNYDYENEPSEITKIRNKQVVMQRLYMDGVEGYMLSKVTFGEPITIKGYPTKDGNGFALNTSSILVGISSKSKNKDAAWEFIREFYTKEGQDSVDWSFSGFPVRKDVLEEVLQKAKEAETETAPDGTKYVTVWGFQDIEMYIPAPTDEDINEIKEIINSADKLTNINTEIFSMISEEAEAFFKGQKTAKEVADVIQSRVSIYVKENR